MKNKKQRRQKNIHHRRAKCYGGSNDPSNIVEVDKKLHECYHTLFGPGNVYEIARILNQTWIDPYYKLVVLPRVCPVDLEEVPDSIPNQLKLQF